MTAFDPQTLGETVLHALPPGTDFVMVISLGRRIAFVTAEPDARRVAQLLAQALVAVLEGKPEGFVEHVVQAPN